MIKYFYLFYFLASAAFAKYQGIEDMNIDISNIEMLIDHKEIKSKIFQTVQKIDEDYKNAYDRQKEEAKKILDTFIKTKALNLTIDSYKEQNK